MPKFKYTAVNIKKEKFTGTFIAENEKDLAEQLAKQNLYLISSTPYSDKTPSAFWTTGTGKVSVIELASFCRQFATMLNAGITIMDSMQSLITQPYSAYFRKILERIYEDLRGGLMFAECVEKHKKVFPDFFRSMLHVGEESGRLETVLLSLADYYERDDKLKRQTASALAYPMLLLVLIIGIIVLMLVFIVPTFRSALAGMNVPVEGLTKVVYDISDFLLNEWRTVVIVIVVLAGVLFLVGRTKGGRRFYDYLKLHLPLFGKVNLDLITPRFARGFSLLISSGMDVVEALNTIAIVINNTWMKERYLKAVDNVCQGMSIALAFKSYKLFPDMMLQMIAVGEQTAGLEEVLSKSFAYFDGKAESALNNLTNKLQPIMMIIMGVVVGALFIAVYSPMLSIMKNLNV